MAQTTYLNVFVHGLFGWGESNPVYRRFPQWGMGSGDMLKELRRRGYLCCAPVVGPLSSAWDRACELYAQLTGTTVDYGAAHSKEHGHARFGRSYREPLWPGWSAERKINLIGHSFGGATARMLLELLANGSEEECAACDDPSELFRGGKGEWVHSITCLASPHNGSTLGMADENPVALIAKMNEGLIKAMISFGADHTYDVLLDQFGASYDTNEGVVENMLRLVDITIEHKDGAFFDLSVDGALALNRKLPIQPNVYYFSEPTCRTVPKRRGDAHRPERDMPPILRKSAVIMGGFMGAVTPGGVKIDRAWCPNDGMVNTISSLCPMGAPHREIAESETAFVPGLWHVLPVRKLDHLEIVGGIGHPIRARRIYKAIMNRIDHTILE